MANDALFTLLVCPLGGAPFRREDDVFICTKCGPRFKVEDEIPNMLIEEAELPEGCTSVADLLCVKSGDAKLD